MLLCHIEALKITGTVIGFGKVNIVNRQQTHASELFFVADGPKFSYLIKPPHLDALLWGPLWPS